MKKFMKVLLVAVLAVVLISSFCLGNSFKIESDDSGSLHEAVTSLGGSVLGLVKTLAYIVAAIMVVVVAVQYLIGTPAKKQELKGKLWSILIGVLLLVSGATILGILEDTFTEVIDDGTSEVQP